MLHNTGQFIDDHEQTVAQLQVNKTENTRERTQGLLALSPLQDNEGLWIKPCNAIHTVGMKYPLDLLYLDRQQRLIKVIQNIKPLRLSASLLAKSVIEVKAGTAKRLGLKKGMLFKWETQ